MEITGLTMEEVKQRRRAGLENRVVDDVTKTEKQIVMSNIFTYFNGIFALLSILLIIVGSWKSLTFLPVIIANTAIGIFQELRAKKVLDNLSLLDVTNYKVIRDGQKNIISSEKLVKDDVILLEEGQQIPADAVVLSGSVAVNESLLTGESDEIEKHREDELMSGSFVVSGECYARLTHVGNASYAAELTRKAKSKKEKPAEMIRDIEWIIRISGVLIIPIGIALVYQAVAVNEHSFQEGVTSMVAAVIGMIPEGMYLLATVALALSAARLAMKKVLLHDMRSIETLARVDVLCVDKTGTITGEEMEVYQVFAPTSVEHMEESLLWRYVNTIPDHNLTMRALEAYCKEKGDEKFQAVDLMPFSSKQKYSQIQTAEHLYRLGAPEYLLTQGDLQANQMLIKDYTAKGQRVLALVCDGKPVLFVALANGIRKEAPDIFTYFHKRGVEIKVISGDNPLTVSKVAEQAKIVGAENYVDASTLKDMEDIEVAVQQYTVFGRVKPEQKKDIVKALQKQKKKVAMTGDGVNDILAMKEADCSIAMGGGSDAARQAAQVVLMDSDFSKMKDIVGEGRRDVNNITRSATLFLYKNIFSLLLAIFSIYNTFTYPLQPNQVSLVSMFNIGLPAFLLALENNENKQESKFLKHTLLKAMPAALTSFFSIAFLVLFGQLFSIAESDISTASTYLLAVIGFMILWNITKPANPYHLVVFAVCILGMLVSVFHFQSLFSLQSISLKCAALCAVFAIAEVTIMRALTSLFENAGDWKEQLLEKGKTLFVN